MAQATDFIKDSVERYVRSHLSSIHTKIYQPQNLTVGFKSRLITNPHTVSSNIASWLENAAREIFDSEQFKEQYKDSHISNSTIDYYKTKIKIALCQYISENYSPPKTSKKAYDKVRRDFLIHLSLLINSDIHQHAMYMNDYPEVILGVQTDEAILKNKKFPKDRRLRSKFNLVTYYLYGSPQYSLAKNDDLLRGIKLLNELNREMRGATFAEERKEFVRTVRVLYTKYSNTWPAEIKLKFDTDMSKVSEIAKKGWELVETESSTLSSDDTKPAGLLIKRHSISSGLS